MTLDPLVSSIYHGRDLLLQTRFRLVFPHRARLLKKNSELHNRHANLKRCFVIGNGPSLKTQDLKPLKDEVTIVCNSFFQHPDHALISPQYYCVGDPTYSADTPNCIAWLREIENKMPRTNLFFPTQAEALFKKYAIFSNHNVHYVQRTHIAHSAQHVRIDFTKPLNVGVSTGCSIAIPLAVYLGFREIYIIGFDSNWLGALNDASVHFYDTNPYYPHFDKTLIEGATMEGELLSVHLEFKSHRLLRKKAALLGARIFNATNGGWLDMYPRVRYEELF